MAQGLILETHFSHFNSLAGKIYQTLPEHLFTHALRVLLQKGALYSNGEQSKQFLNLIPLLKFNPMQMVLRTINVI